MLRSPLRPLISNDLIDFGSTFLIKPARDIWQASAVVERRSHGAMPVAVVVGSLIASVLSSRTNPSIAVKVNPSLG